MSALLRTAWTLLSVPALFVIACAYGLLWLMPPGRRPLQTLAGFFITVGLAMLALRIAKVVEAGVWRLLPDGYRTIIRAIGLFMLAIALLPGKFGDHALAGPLADVPFGIQLANVIFFTLLGVLLLAGIGRRVPRLLVFAYLFGCFVSLHFAMRSFAQVPAFWMAAAGLCAAAWLYASFGKRSYRHASAGWRRLHDILATPKLASTRAWMPFIPFSPAGLLLRSRRSARTGLPFAALIVVGWAAFQHVVRGDGIPVERDSFLYPSVLWVTVFLVVVLSQDIGAAARSLWLRWGDSRGKVFGLAERMLFRDAVILCTIAWATVTLLAWLRGLPIDAPVALMALASHFGAAIGAIYLALAFSTFHAWWQKLICAALSVGAVTFLSFLWLDALGAGQQAIGRIDAELLLVLFLILVAVRTLAWWRWRTIDWACFRPLRNKR